MWIGGDEGRFVGLMARGGRRLRRRLLPALERHDADGGTERDEEQDSAQP
jgi:hypothetical protein